MSLSGAVTTIGELQGKLKQVNKEDSLALTSNNYNVALNNVERNLDQEEVKN